MATLKRTLGLLLVGGALLAGPSVATAHDTRWYWTESLAESSLSDHYSAVTDAYCIGLGVSTRTRSGKRGYKHFDCLVDFDDGGSDSGKLHVTGQYGFRFYWRN